jgi:hypothetical protein
MLALYRMPLWPGYVLYALKLYVLVPLAQQALSPQQRLTDSATSKPG